MSPIDRAILEFCAKDFRRLKDLRAEYPGGTLYRRAKRLIKIGWLERQGPLYRATNAGRRNLIEHQEGQWDQLAHFYSPLALIPTEEHRALVELILAAVMVRQHPTRGDRHPFFLCFGDTFHWKTTWLIAGAKAENRCSFDAPLRVTSPRNVNSSTRRLWYWTNFSPPIVLSEVR
jgi:hypothetical protein